MQQLQEQLALVVDPDMQVTRVSTRVFAACYTRVRVVSDDRCIQRFLKKLRRPREVYNRLADLLELYAKGKFELS